MRLLLLIAFSLSLIACGKDDENSGAPPYPGIGAGGEVRGERRFSTLMSRNREGRVSRTPWAGYWFPYQSEGISTAASRYESASGQGGAVSWERSHHGSSVPGVQSWWGHCNGWAAAAVLYPEPRAARSGFEVAEQKALLSEIAMEVGATFFGRRHDGANNASSPTFRDVHPNQFFLVLLNYVGRGLPIVIDRYTGNQVWNHPVVGYRVEPFASADYLGPDPERPNVHRVNARLRVWWARDDVPAGKVTDAFTFEDNASFQSRELRMELWLDGPPDTGTLLLARDGDAVLGGAWRNGNLESPNSHPDYIWVVDGIRPSSGYSNPEIEHTWVTSRFGR
jgi:hypothetical protein